MTERITRREFLKVSALGMGAFLTPEIKAPCAFFNHGDTNSQKVAITVDDGWFPDIVEKMVKESQRLEIPISAFPVGTVILQNPNLWCNVKEAGIEIYNHTQNHKDLGQLDLKRIEEQLREWEKTYQNTFGEKYKNKIIRPPFGNGIDANLFNAADKLGYKGVTGWSVGSKGYSSFYSPDKVWQDIKDKITSGSIILLHFAQNDLEILPRIAELLEEKSLKAVPLSQLPGIPIYNPFTEIKVKTAPNPEKQLIPR